MKVADRLVFNNKRSFTQTAISSCSCSARRTDEFLDSLQEFLWAKYQRGKNSLLRKKKRIRAKSSASNIPIDIFVYILLYIEIISRFIYVSKSLASTYTTQLAFVGQTEYLCRSCRMYTTKYNSLINVMYAYTLRVCIQYTLRMYTTKYNSLVNVIPLKNTKDSRSLCIYSTYIH